MNRLAINRRFTHLAHFALIGGIGFVIDACVFSAVYYGMEGPLMFSRIVAFLCAATTTWYGNRILTFAVRDVQQAKLRQWGKSMCSAMLSGFPNFVVFKFTTNILGTEGIFIFIALILGVGVGMLSNYALSCYWVFPDNHLPKN